MFKITFRYKDELSHWEWREQQCVCSSLKECIRFYGLDSSDCEYQIISQEKVDN